jgi:tRNA/rRNA methyltransferase
MRRARAGGDKVGVMFGAERQGLTNDDLTLADELIQTPLNPAYSSLNLGQAVTIVAYEWYQSGDETPERFIDEGRTPPATKEELVNFLERLEAELDACGFLQVEEKRSTMVRNIRNIFQRAQLSEQEVKTLHGIVSGLVDYGRRKTGK